MGEHMAVTAAQWGISREAQDALAAASHQNLAAAYDRGFFDDLMTPYLGLTRDSNLRPDSTVDKLAKLQAGLRQGRERDDDGRQLDAPHRRRLGRAPRQRGVGGGAPPDAARAFVDAETAAVDYVHGEEGLLMAPTYAVPRLLARNGLTLRTSTSTRSTRPSPRPCSPTSRHGRTRSSAIKRLGLDAPLGSIDRSRLNVNGSSLPRATPSPRPVGESSPRWPSSSGRSARRGSLSAASISICAAGGQGVVAILEA